MKSDQRAFAASADAQLTLLDRQVNVFLFDLKNEATEYGFKTGESWSLQLAKDDEIPGLKRNHKPVISIKLYPDDLLNFFRQVKHRLRQPLNEQESQLTISDLANNGINHMVAFPLKFRDR
jgi:hypothetical protein